MICVDCEKNEAVWAIVENYICRLVCQNCLAKIPMEKKHRFGSDWRTFVV